MAFALSGSTITQTGTDTSLAGLVGIAGVTVTDFTSSNLGGYKIYSLTNTLTVSGTLSFNPNTERIVFPNYFTVATLYVNGTLNIDGSQTFNGGSIGFGHFAISFLGLGSVCCDSVDSALRIDNGGTLNLTRASIYTNYLFYWGSAAGAVNITDGRIISARTTTDTTSLIRIRNFCSNLTINKCFFSNISLDFFRPPLLLNGLEWAGTARAFELITTPQGGTNAQVIFSGFKASSVVYTASNYQGADLLLRNAAKNTKYVITHDEATNGSATRVTCQTTFKVKNVTTGSYLTSGSLFLRDKNNGNRLNATYYSGTTVNFVNDRTYFANADGTGSFTSVEVLCYVIRGGSPLSGGLVNIQYDFRDQSNSEQNLFNFIFAAYGYLPTVQNLALFGDALGNAFAGDIAVLPDSPISQSNSVTVAGYTTQSASRFEDIYDYSALEKTLSTAIEYPTASTRVFDSSDGKNGVISYNFKIDPTATGISIDHTNAILKIKALTFTSSRYTDVAIASGKSITLAQAGTYSQVSFSLLATNLLTVAPGNTDLRNWIFASGTTINVSSGLATVTVDSPTGITAGTGVTLQSGVVTISITTTIAASVSVRKVSDNSLIASGTADASGNFTGSYVYPGSTVPAILRARKAGYIPFSSPASVTSAGLTASALLAVDKNYNPTY